MHGISFFFSPHLPVHSVLTRILCLAHTTENELLFAEQNYFSNSKACDDLKGKKNGEKKKIIPKKVIKKRQSKQFNQWTKIKYKTHTHKNKSSVLVLASHKIFHKNYVFSFHKTVSTNILLLLLKSQIKRQSNITT